MAMAVCVDWETENLNTPDDTYVYQKGTVTVEAGNNTQSLRVRVDDNKYWNTETVFIIK
eukprot:gene20988-39407_t